MHTYSAKVLEKLNNVTIKVGVFRAEGEKQEQIGEYERNYPSLFNTFCYFSRGDKEYALYSRNYSATRVMELPNCRDLGGEEPSNGGFCPTDFYVPSYIELETVLWKDRIWRRRVHEPRPENLLPTTMKRSLTDPETRKQTEIEEPTYPVSPQNYYPFGFVAGCVWGDDSTWKIQYLDLSDAEKGIIKRDERFGYIVLTSKQRLKDAVDMTDYDPNEADPYTRISITIEKRFDLQTGEMLDY